MEERTVGLDEWASQLDRQEAERHGHRDPAIDASERLIAVDAQDYTVLSVVSKHGNGLVFLCKSGSSRLAWLRQCEWQQGSNDVMRAAEWRCLEREAQDLREDGRHAEAAAVEIQALALKGDER